MTRHIAVGFLVVATVAGMGWKLASHSETSAAGLQEISLSQNSEHSYAWNDRSMGKRVRVRVMLKEFGDELSATAQVPQISVAAE
jgi:hypothetical protein